MEAPLPLLDLRDLLATRQFRDAHEVLGDLSPAEAVALLEAAAPDEEAVLFRLMPHALAHETFAYLDLDQQERLLDALATRPHRLGELLNELSPDDRTALFEELPGPVTQRLLNLLAPDERRVALRLLGYPEDSIGRLMTPDYVTLRPDWSALEALAHVRHHGQTSETLDVLYCVDDAGRLVGEAGLRAVILATPDTPVADFMNRRFAALRAVDAQESAVPVFQSAGRTALPVTDARGVLVGIVTIDDVLDVAEEEATEDIQKIGGSEALDEPYLDTPLRTLVLKRARWLAVLFVSEMLTASAMGTFEGEIKRAAVLAVFVPLIISSGGNSGSQAATLIIRALAVGEVRLRDAWRVMRREIGAGAALGTLLGSLGMARIALWQALFGTYGPHWALLMVTVGVSVVGVVLWGTLSGAMLPLLMQRLGADPATSSTPFVATLVDVTGLVIYFSVAALLLSGTLL